MPTLARGLILTILREVDYDLYKQYADPENSEDPEYIQSSLNIFEDFVLEYNKYRKG